MYKNSKEQYVNILKQDKQLKIDYKVLQDKKIVKQEVSTFLLDGDNISQDAIFKLETLQKNIPNTYLSTLYIDNNQSIELNNNIDTNNYRSVALNDNYSIVIPNKNIENSIKFFKSAGVDYILSPFSILNEQINNTLKANSLNILIYNNTLYALILDDYKEIKKTFIEQITPFENIKNSNFYTDDIVGQKLYEEIYFLEVQERISDIIQKYYEENEDISFLEKIYIFYTVKQLTDEQLEMLYDTAMIEVDYLPISIDTNFDKLIQKPTVSNYSFTKARDKRSTSSSTLWFTLIIISILTIGTILFYKISSNSKSESKEVKTPIKVVKQVKEPVKKIVEKEVIKLPNHNLLNTKIVEQTMMFFDLIPYDAVLLELELKKDSSTIVSNFTIDSSASKDMIEKLSKIYDDSKIILQHKNKALVSTIIANSGYKIKDEKNSAITLLKYQAHNFMKIQEFTTFLKSITIENSDIKYISKVQEKFLTYNYSVTSMINKPKEFFDFVSVLNKKAIPLNITYPIEFAKVKDKIEVKFNFQFHQQNKKSSSQKD
ncbi:MAG: hypothetical protein U9R16_05690 [Campylobacterota bacterium]|nr:hypothetical protein [Campylobacterota bacterium]